MTAPTYEDLVDEVRVLRERLAALTNPADATVLAAELGLRPKAAEILALLYRRGTALAISTIYDAVFQHSNGDGPEPRIVDVYFCRIRAQAKQQGWPGVIITHWGTGRSLSPELRAFIGGILEPRKAAA